MQGKLIAIEGVDGAGKSTQAKLLKEKLSDKYEIVLTSEPTKGEIGEKIRKHLSGDPINALDLQKLYVMDRKEHLENLIIPSIKEGKIVITDRYILSNLAYSENPNEIMNLNKNFIKPDLTIFININPDIAINRLSGSNFDIFHNKEKLLKVSDSYKKSFNHFENIFEVDGNKDMEDLNTDIIEIIQKTI